jgi:hypothetical protein
MKNFVFDRRESLGGEYSPVIASTEVIANHAKSRRVLEKVISIGQTLAPDQFADAMIEIYREGLSRFGDAWGYSDLPNLLYALADLGKPADYLEIGTRRGRSACMVAAASPYTNMYCADLWQKNYANNENPGPDFVSEQLRQVGHTGAIHFISGDSHVEIPKFLAKNPELSFDLITVDGDHSVEGAWDDLVNVVDTLRVGGVIVFDDIDNPYCPGLLGVWERFIGENQGLRGHVISNSVGLGVAFAIRVAPASRPMRKKNLESLLPSWLRRR